MDKYMRKIRWLMNLAMGGSRLQKMFFRHYRDGVVDETFSVARLALQVARSHGSKVVDHEANTLEGFIRMIYGDESARGAEQAEAAQPTPQPTDSVLPQEDVDKNTP